MDILNAVNLFLSIIGYCFTGIIAIMGVIGGFINLHLNREIWKSLNLIVDKSTRDALKYYVPTKGQNIDPCTDDDFTQREAFISKELIPFFIKSVFIREEIQYFVILADSGMGKTTFMLKLYSTYYKKLRRKHDIVLIPLSLSNSIERINKIEKKSNTILLLDGFDEDREALIDYKKRLKKICDTTENFFKVIMTCRTQFFPDSESEPKDTGKIKFGTGDKKIQFIKYYISPFVSKDIDQYLKKKYRFSFKKRKKAKELILKCPKLMMRPMLLNYISDLMNSKISYDYTYQIYEVLVDKWVERESIPNEEIYSLTEKLAELMFEENLTFRPGYEFEELCKKFDLVIKPIDAKAKSLLNRNAAGLYKFAHKSIYEFVLAKKAFNDEKFRIKFIESKLVGLDMAKLFYTEMCNNYFNHFCNMPYKNISYMQVEQFVFNEYDFSYMNMDYSRFYKCTFNFCKFEGVNASHIDFSDSTIIDVDFTEANLNNSIFSGTKIHNCIFKNAKLEYATFTSGSENKTIIDKSNDFENAVMKHANFSGMDLSDYHFLKKANLFAINMKMCVIDSSNFLCNKDLRLANLNGTKFRNCDLTNILFSGSKMLDVEISNSDLTNADLSDVNFENMQIVDSKLISSIWTEATLWRGELKNSNFTSAIFKQSKVLDSTFCNCKFYNIITQGAAFRNVINNDCKMDIKFQEFIKSQVTNKSDVRKTHEPLRVTRKIVIN